MEINLSKDIVYLAAPKLLLSSDLYDRAFRFILMRSNGVVNPKWLFKSNQDFLDRYEIVLDPCTAMVIVSDDNYIGKGIYFEYQYFCSRFCNCYYYMEANLTQKLIPIITLQVINDDDWKNYAVIKY